MDVEEQFGVDDERMITCDVNLQFHELNPISICRLDRHSHRIKTRRASLSFKRKDFDVPCDNDRLVEAYEGAGADTLVPD